MPDRLTPPQSAETHRLVDQFGYETTLVSPADPRKAIEEWNATVLAFLAHGAETPVRLGAALAAAPDFPMAQAAKGFFMLLLGRPELREVAAEALRAAQAHETAATARERAMIGALGLYLAGGLTPAANLLDATLAEHPRDGLLMKLVHAIRFVLGDAAGMRRSVEAALPLIDAANPARPFALGCHAFALEETGAYVAAERAGREAVRLAPNDAWGLHAVAHVMDMTNRAAEGVAWITGAVDAFGHCNNFGYHIWWHLALFHLDRGEHAEVLRLYDEKIRKDHTDDYRDISNGASLLSRLEFEGVELGERWEELAELSANRSRTAASSSPIYTIFWRWRAQAVSARARRCSPRCDARPSGGSAAWALWRRSPGLARRKGCTPSPRATTPPPTRRWRRRGPSMTRVGGSHAQRDVFERVAIEAALRSGLLTEARAALQDRARRRGALDGYAEARLERIAALTEQRGAQGDAVA